MISFHLRFQIIGFSMFKQSSNHYTARLFFNEKWYDYDGLRTPELSECSRNYVADGLTVTYALYGNKPRYLIYNLFRTSCKIFFFSKTWK